MAISRVDTTIISAGTSATSITPTAPAGVTTSDLIVVVASLSKASTTWANTSYAGWTMLETGLVDGSLITQVMYRVATGSGDAPPQMDLTATQTGGMIATAAAYRGVNTTTPFIAENAIGEATSQTTHSAPSITNTDAAAWGVYAGHARQVATPLTWTPGTGLTELEDADNGVANTNNVAATWCDTNGVVGTGSVTYSASTSAATGSATMWAAFLQPAAGGTPATVTGVTAVTGGSPAAGSLAVGSTVTGVAALSRAVAPAAGTVTTVAEGFGTVPFGDAPFGGDAGPATVIGVSAIAAPVGEVGTPSGVATATGVTAVAGVAGVGGLATVYYRFQWWDGADWHLIIPQVWTGTAWETPEVTLTAD